MNSAQTSNIHKKRHQKYRLDPDQDVDQQNLPQHVFNHKFKGDRKLQSKNNSMERPAHNDLLPNEIMAGVYQIGNYPGGNGPHQRHDSDNFAFTQQLGPNLPMQRRTVYGQAFFNTPQQNHYILQKELGDTSDRLDSGLINKRHQGIQNSKNELKQHMQKTETNWHDQQQY